MLFSLGLGLSIISLSSISCYCCAVVERVTRAKKSKKFKEDRKFRRYIRDIESDTCKRALWIPIVFYLAVEFGLADRDGNLFGSLLFNEAILAQHKTSLAILTIIMLVVLSIKYFIAYFEVSRTGRDING